MATTTLANLADVTAVEDLVVALDTAVDGKQDTDATLTALAGLNADAGLLEQTGADAFTKRALGVGASTSVPTRADADTRYAAAAHTHAEGDVTGLTAALAAKADAADVYEDTEVDTLLAEKLAGWGIPRTMRDLLAKTDAADSVLSGDNGWFFRVHDRGTISKIGLDVVTQSGNICVAVYANTGSGVNAAPGTRLATSGSVACPATGYQEVALGASVDVEEGDWFALSADNATATFRCNISGGGASDLGKAMMGLMNAAFPLPSSVTITGWYRTPVFLMRGTP